MNPIIFPVNKVHEEYKDNPDDKEHFQINIPVAISKQFYGWVFGLGNYVTIAAPEHIKKEIANKLVEIRKRYD